MPHPTFRLKVFSLFCICIHHERKPEDENALPHFLDGFPKYLPPARTEDNPDSRYLRLDPLERNFSSIVNLLPFSLVITFRIRGMNPLLATDADVRALDSHRPSLKEFELEH